jgi:hypothetical protein
MGPMGTTGRRDKRNEICELFHTGLPNAKSHLSRARKTAESEARRRNNYKGQFIQTWIFFDKGTGCPAAMLTGGPGMQRAVHDYNLAGNASATYHSMKHDATFQTVDDASKFGDLFDAARTQCFLQKNKSGLAKEYQAKLKTLAQTPSFSQGDGPNGLQMMYSSIQDLLSPTQLPVGSYGDGNGNAKTHSAPTQ